MVVTEVTRSLHSYLGVEREHTIDAVLVAGGTGIEPRVAAELHRRLGITVEALDPAPALGMAEGSTSASAFVSALGLAVCRAEGVGLPVDFLNPKRAPVQRDTKKLAVIGVVAALALAVGGIFLAAGTRYWAAKANLESLKSEYRELEVKNKPVTLLAKRVDTIEQWQKGGRNWLDQWAYLSGVFPPCTETYVTSLNSNPDGSIILKVKATSSRGPGQPGRATQEGRIRLQARPGRHHG